MSVTSYQLMPRVYDINPGSNGSSPLAWKVVGSADGVNWTLLDAQDLTVSDPSGQFWIQRTTAPTTFLIPRENTSPTYTFVRIIVVKTANITNVSVIGGTSYYTIVTYTSIQQFNVQGFPLPNARKPALIVGGAMHVLGNVRIAGGGVVTHPANASGWAPVYGNAALSGNVAVAVAGGVSVGGNTFLGTHAFVRSRAFIGGGEANTYALDVSGNDARLGPGLVTSAGTSGAVGGPMMYVVNQRFGYEGSGGTGGTGAVATSYALSQTADGTTRLNAAPTKTVQILVGGSVTTAVFTSAGLGLGATGPSSPYMLDVSGSVRTFDTTETTTFGVGALVLNAGGSSVAGNVYVGGNVCLLRGNIGIGTTSPAYKLDVSGNVRISVAQESINFTSGALVLPSGGISMGGNCFVGGNCYVKRNVGVGTTNPLYTVDVSGTAHVSSLTTASSTNGALIVDGGVNIKDTADSSSTGGALYSAGGIRMKNGYITDTTNSTSTTGALYSAGGIRMKNAYISDTTVATSTTGALIVVGGIDIQDVTDSSSTTGALYSAGGIRMKNGYITDTTDSSSTAGALYSAGGIRMKNGYITDTTGSSSTAGALYSAGGIRMKNSYIADTTDSSSTAGALYSAGGIRMKNGYITDTTGSSSTGGALYSAGGISMKNSYIADTTDSSSTAGALYSAGGIRMKNSYIADTTDSSATAGALIVVGGISMKNAYASGSMTAASFYASSDYRIKTDIVALTDTDVSVDALRPIQYTNTLTGCKDIGLLAHELQNVYPWLVVGEKDGQDMQHVNYMGLIGLLIHEVQGLKHKIDSK
jgi:hypothetical protein